MEAFMQSNFQVTSLGRRPFNLPKLGYNQVSQALNMTITRLDDHKEIMKGSHVKSFVGCYCLKYADVCETESESV